MSFFKELIVRITGDSSGLQKETQKAQGVLGTFESKLSGIGKGIAAAFAVGEIIRFGEACVKAFDEGAKAEAKLLSAMKGNEEATKRLVAVSESLQSKTLFGHDTIQNAQMFLATMGLTENQITQIIPLIMDFATKMGTDLQGAASIVSKTIGSNVNALARYGIEVTGAAGSSQRFDSALKGLTKQVGGLASAATGAGVSGLEQMKNLMDNVKESIGQIIAIPLNPFLTKLKEIAELRLGLTTENSASDMISKGRDMVARAESVEAATKALKDYNEQLEKERKNLEWEKGSIAGKSTPAKTFISTMIPGMKQVGLNEFDRSTYEEQLAQIEAINKATKELNDLAKDPEAIEKLQKESGAIGSMTKNLNYYIEQNKELATEQLTASTARAKQITQEIANNQKVIDSITKNMTHVEAIQAQIKDLESKYDSTADDAKKRSIGDTIKLLQEQLVIESQLRGENVGRDITMTKMPMKGGFSQIGKDKAQLALEKIQTDKGLPIKQMSETTIPKDYLDYFKAINDAKTDFKELKTFADELNDSLKNIGDSLIQGADNWSDFGKMALNALKGLIAGIIAKGIADAIANSIEATSALGPFSVGIGALAGGLAAGAFSTLVPSFAGGGVVNQPTLAMIGDNPGRKEAVIPSELWGQLGGGGYIAETKISFRDLWIGIQREQSSQKRLGK